MKPEKAPKLSIFEMILANIGVHEAMFLSGLALSFVGIWGVSSIFWALIVCGGLLIGVGVVAAALSQFKVVK